MARPKYVPLEHRTAKLAERFGYEYAVSLFGQPAIDSIPLLKAGPNKGKPRGVLHWRKALTAGWVAECQGPVALGGLVVAWVGEGLNSTRDGAMRGEWYGRTQDLAGSRSVLGQEARDRDEAQRARAAAEWEAEKAELLAERAK